MQGVRQKSTAGVSGIRRGHFFAVRRSRCPHICKKEVINMLIAKYDYETDIAVQRAEEREIAFAEGIERGIEQGISQGIEQGISQGIEQGISRGSYQTKLETAKLMKQANCELDFIIQMTSLSKEEIEVL